MIELKVKRIPWPFPEAVHAVTVWPFVVIEEAYWDDKCLRVHEYVHYRQQRKWLVIPWLLVYVALLPMYRQRPKEHPLEVAAYLAERECKETHE